MSRVHLTLDQPVTAETEIVLAVPIDTPEQTLRDIDVAGFDVTQAIALNSAQPVLRLRPVRGAAGEISFRFENGGAFPDWIHTPNGGPHETPSPELVALMAEIAPPDLAPSERVERIIRHIEERFIYGVRAVGLGDEAEAMPPLSCGVHKGTCVDTHSYGVAAFRAAGVPAAYVSGLYFAEGTTVSSPGHCWMAVRAEGAPYHWDISHFLKYNLGPVRPVLNPKAGVRFAMAVGRDVVVEGADGPVTFTRLCGFNVLSGPGKGARLATRASLSQHDQLLV